MTSERPVAHRRRASDPAPTRRLRGDSGAIIVEAAFVTPVFILFLFGILEFGGTMRDYLTLNNATGAAARQASISANSSDADYQVIQDVKRESSAMPLSQIEEVVVFHPAGPSDSVPAGCESGTPSVGTGPNVLNACNVYTATAFTWTSTSTNWGCGATSADRYWCPTTRKTAQTGTNGPPDYVGVYVKIKHPYVTGLFGNSVELTKTSIIKIEPQSLK